MSDAPAPTTAPPRRRRWLFLALVLGLPLVLVLLLPTLIGLLAPGLVVDGLEAALRVRARVDSIELGWRGTAEVRGLSLEDLEGRPLLSAGTARVDAALLSALGGALGAEVHLADVDVHVRRDAEGRWCFEDLVREPAPPEEEEERERDDDAELPELFLRAGLERGAVRVHGPDGVTEITDLEVRFDLPSLERAASLAYSGRLRGPGGDGGGFSGEGTVTVAENGRVGPDTVRADVETRFETLDLASLGPAVRLASEVEGLAGRVDGDLRFVLEPGHAPTLRGRVAATGVDLTGPAFPGGRFGLESIALDAAPGDGPESQRIGLDVGGFLAANLASRGIRLPQGESGGASWWKLLPEETVLELTGDLDRLDALARGFTGGTESLVGGPLALRLSAAPEDSGVALGLRLEPEGLLVGGARLRGAPLVANLRVEPGAEGEPSLGFSADLATESLGAQLGEKLGGRELPAVPVELALAGRWSGAGGDLDMETLRVDTPFLAGELAGSLRGLTGGERRVEGLEGELSYVPGPLMELVRPFLPAGAPVELSGDEPRALRVDLSGDLSDLTPSALLAALDADLDLAIGGLRAAGLELGGDVALGLHGGALGLGAQLAAGGGKASLDLEGGTGGGPRGDVPATLRLGLQQVALAGGLEKLVGRLHPALAGAADATGKAGLAGLVSGELSLGLGEPLDPELLAGGLSALPLGKLSGSGRLEVDGVELSGSELVRTMVAHLGAGPGAGGKGADLGAVAFSLDGGRLRYDEPWTWTVGGTKTTFTGSVGLDRTLDLTWSAPVTADLARRVSALAPLEGEMLEVPLRGSLSSPKLALDELVRDAGERALKKMAGDRLEEELGKGLGKELGGILGGGAGGGLGGLLGGQSGGQKGEGESPTKSPASLLAEADRLWGEGEQEAAQALYRELRDRHAGTPVFLLNAKRIRDRAR